MLHALLFTVLPYLSIASFIVGFICKCALVCKNCNGKNQFFKDNSLKILPSGIISIVILHIAGYFLIKMFFVFTNLSADTINTASKIIQASLTIVFLTIFTAVVFYKKIKQRANVFGNMYNNIITVIIVTHIAFGYLAIMLVGQGGVSGYEKRVALTSYFKGLFSFNLESHKYLLSTHYVTNLHLILGFLLIAFIPYSTILNRLYVMISKGYYVIAKN